LQPKKMALKITCFKIATASVGIPVIAKAFCRSSNQFPNDVLPWPVAECGKVIREVGDHPNIFCSPQADRVCFARMVRKELYQLFARWFFD
jgi:hypothetical protein